MVLIGLGLLIVWLIVLTFGLELAKAILITAVILIILGLLIGDRPWSKH